LANCTTERLISRAGVVVAAEGYYKVGSRVL